MGWRAKIIGASVVASLVLALLSDDAEARRGGRRFHLGPGLKHGQKADGPLLSRDELRFCLVQQSVVDTLSNDVDEMGAMIERERSGLDRTDAEAVAQINAAVAAYNQRVREQNVEVAEFNERCAGKPYYQSDLPSPDPDLSDQSVTNAPSGTLSSPPSAWIGWVIGGAIVLGIIGLFRRARYRSRAQPLEAQMTPEERVMALAEAMRKERQG